MSKLRKDDQSCIPGLTLIVYYSDKEWTARKMYSMILLNWPEEPEMLNPVVP